jgi:hypothetical protein
MLNRIVNQARVSFLCKVLQSLSFLDKCLFGSKANGSAIWLSMFLRVCVY